MKRNVNLSSFVMFDSFVIALRRWVLWSMVLTGIFSAHAQDESRKPNIVILFADNLGYNDIGIFGSPTARTPNIDRLGFEGIKLNNWNSAAHLCSASRASLLTGKYPVRTGVYPAVFKPGAVYGLLPNETTIAEYLKEEGYATSIVGKWHLGHRDPYLPTNQGFDEWIGIPYHMSGGSLDHHECGFDKNKTMWLPLYDGTTIVEQPVQVQHLAQHYAQRATDFIHRNSGNPFFLYMAFSHVHQLCAPADGSEQEQCQWASKAFSEDSPKATFVNAVEEMDWIAGEVLNALESENLANDTLVIFTSDNGPWVAEESCSGSKGPFEGRWLQEHTPQSCTACPHDYVPDPTPGRPRRCVSSTPRQHIVDGVHCGSDTGLGGTWEANLRMPGLARWPGRIAPGTETMALVSTLDVVPTVLSLLNITIPAELDGLDISNVLFRKSSSDQHITRVLFFWRDGFAEGPLPAPYGRFDVVAAKYKRIKAWFWTKSAHYNADVEEFHSPPLLFDVLADPAEAFPLDPKDHMDTIQEIYDLVEKHKASVDWTYPLALATDPKYIPCADKNTFCRTSSPPDTKISIK